MSTPEKEQKHLFDNKLLKELGVKPVLFTINLRKISDPIETESHSLDFLKEPLEPARPQPKRGILLADVEVDVFRVESSNSNEKIKGRKQL
jgi:hypothetical protein